MQQATETITVINRWYNAESGLDEWIPTVIRGASWHNKIAATLANDGLKTADTATVRIPVDANTGGRSYMTPAAYKAAQSTPGGYTLARGDLVVRAEIPTPTSAEPPITPASIVAAYEDCITVLAVTDNTRRPHGAHRKVVGA